jgi:hypothetical protein
LITARNLTFVVAYNGVRFQTVEVVMELYGVPPTPDVQGGGSEAPEDVLNLGAWFQKSWNIAGNIGERSADFVAGIFDTFREADALGFDSEGDQTEN